MDSVQDRMKEYRKEQKAANRKAFWQVGLTYVALGLVAYTMHIWIPVAIKFFETLG